MWIDSVKTVSHSDKHQEISLFPWMESSDDFDFDPERFTLSTDASTMTIRRSPSGSTRSMAPRQKIEFKSRVVSRNCHARIKLENSKVSGIIHCTGIVYTYLMFKCYVYDESSSAGTTLNGVSLQKQEFKQLHTGDILTFGRTVKQLVSSFLSILLTYSTCYSGSVSKNSKGVCRFTPRSTLAVCDLIQAGVFRSLSSKVTIFCLTLVIILSSEGHSL